MAICCGIKGVYIKVPAVRRAQNPVQLTAWLGKKGPVIVKPLAVVKVTMQL